MRNAINDTRRGNRRRKRRHSVVYVVLVMLLATLLVLDFAPLSGTSIKEEKDSGYSVLCSIEQLNNSDAKLFNDYIITGVDGALEILSRDGKKLQHLPNVHANWLAGYEEDNLIIYSNADKEIGLAAIDDNGKLISNRMLMKTSELAIDPTIMKVNDKYYFTITKVVGNVNNDDASKPNGCYTVELYEMDNVESEPAYVSKLLECRNNIEDIDFLPDQTNSAMLMVYEKEILDKGDSSICIRKSAGKSLDGMKQWSDEIELLPAGCDHEQANLIVEDGTYNLFYSCDRNNPGTSYNGAGVYTAQYDENFNSLRKDICLIPEGETGKLLYDVRIRHNVTELLYEKDYLGEDTLVLTEKIG